jgi:membrane associated rhomboid family serine protease
MEHLSITNLIIASTLVVSYLGFQNDALREKLILRPYIIHRQKDYFRLLSSGWVHSDWVHLLMNMFVFYMFGNLVEGVYTQIFNDGGRLIYLLLYLGGVVFANLPTFYKYRNTPYYGSLGASGGVAAILFAYILISPWSEILIYGIIPVKSLIAGVLYVVYESYMSRKGGSQINHDAHLYGALFGFIFTALAYPPFFTSLLAQLGLGSGY